MPVLDVALVVVRQQDRIDYRLRHPKLDRQFLTGHCVMSSLDQGAHRSKPSILEALAMQNRVQSRHGLDAHRHGVVHRVPGVFKALSERGDGILLFGHSSRH